jgi:predicted kinase
MPECILTVGLPGSGKSTWAREQCDGNPGKYKMVSKDDLRAMLDNGVWSKKNETFVLQMRDAIILAALEDGKSVIVHDTNLHHKHLQQIKDIVRGRAVVTTKSFLDVPIETCIKQDLKRFNSVGEAVIRKMYKDFLAPAPADFPYVPYNDVLPDCIIVDIDGTIARMNGRGPFDWHRVGEDVPHEQVLHVIDCYRQGYDPAFGWNVPLTTIVMSGRDASCREQTEKWLSDLGFKHHHLLMRRVGDSRKDTIVKEEIYRMCVEGVYNVRAVFDDRNSVVATWRSLGLPVFQVAEGDF